MNLNIKAMTLKLKGINIPSALETAPDYIDITYKLSEMGFHDFIFRFAYNKVDGKTYITCRNLNKIAHMIVKKCTVYNSKSSKISRSGECFVYDIQSIQKQSIRLYSLEELHNYLTKLST